MNPVVPKYSCDLWFPALSGSRVTSPQKKNRPLETLEHLFLECPVGKQALEWLCALWQRIDTGPAPLFMATVLLADDASVWRPSSTPAGLQTLWTILRVTMLKRAWLARQACVFHADPSAMNAVRVVAAFVQEIGSLIRQDWL